MGTLTLPSSGTVYLDANCLIYSVEKIEPYSSLLSPVWASSHSGSIEIVCSQLVLLETLVKPVREGDGLLESLFRELLLESGGVHLLTITQATLEQALLLRAHVGLKTPDAIHAATALGANCSLFLTNDPAFTKAQDLPVALLSSFVGL